MRKKLQHAPGEHFLSVTTKVVNCPAYRVLGYASKALFFDLRAKVNGTNNGNIEAVLSNLKHKGWRSSATLATALFELQAMGFLVKTRSGGIANSTRVCSLYSFTDLETYDQPKVGVHARKPTRDYLQYESVGEAQAALVAGVKKLREEAKTKAYGKKKQPQNLKLIASKSEVASQFTASEGEQGSHLKLQKMK